MWFSSTQVSHLAFSHLTVSVELPSSYRLQSLVSFFEVWIYIRKGSRGPSFAEEFKTCPSGSEEQR